MFSQVKSGTVPNSVVTVLCISKMSIPHKPPVSVLTVRFAETDVAKIRDKQTKRPNVTLSFGKFLSLDGNT